MRTKSRIPILIAATLVAACAGTPAHPPTGAQAQAEPAAVTALYAQMDADVTRYENGLAAANRGDSDSARTGISASLDDLRAVAARCGTTPGCDSQRFVTALDRLLRLGLGDLATAPGEGGSTSPTPEANGTAGEGSPVVGSLPELDRSLSLLKGHDLGALAEQNGPVKAALEEWLTQYRPNLVTAYVNYQFLRYRMWPEYHKAGLPEALLFGMLAKESGGKVHAVSRAGAAGPLQFMPATGQRFGLGVDDGFDERFDPAMAARANAAYIDEQLKVFNNDLGLVLAAYNAGEGAVQRLAGKARATSFWDPGVYFNLSQETRDYVPMVLAAAWLYMHPDRYNLEFPKIDGKPGTISLAQPSSLAELTICLGESAHAVNGWFRALRNLNPRLDPQQELAAGTTLAVPFELEQAYRRQCVGTRWATLAASLHSASLPIAPTVAARATAPRSRTYVVRKGDTLMRISERNDCPSPQSIARENGLRAPAFLIHPGQKLHLPSACSRQ
ncbi:MAG: transglycosylase SLT domain-containing protein [Lysobacterales bacterium]